MARYKRKAIPDGVKFLSCLWRIREAGRSAEKWDWSIYGGIKARVWAALTHFLGFPEGAEIEWDHDPPLELRPDNADKTDYDPPQLDPRHIFPILKADHRAKTTGRRGESKLSISGNGDKSRIDKVKRLRGETKQKYITKKWPSRTIPSRPFPKPR